MEPLYLNVNGRLTPTTLRIGDHVVLEHPSSRVYLAVFSRETDLFLASQSLLTAGGDNKISLPVRSMEAALAEVQKMLASLGLTTLEISRINDKQIIYSLVAVINPPVSPEA